MRTEATDTNILLRITRIYDHTTLNHQGLILKIFVLSTIREDNIVHHSSIVQLNLIVALVNYLQWYFIFV